MPNVWKSDDGSLVIFDRGDGRSPYLFGKAKHPETKKWIFFSTETADAQSAINFGLKKQGEIGILAKHDVDIRVPNFERAASIYRSTTTDPSILSEIDRFLVPYFKTKPLNKIGNDTVAQFREWRTNYWLTGPGKDGEEITYVRRGKKVKLLRKYIDPHGEHDLVVVYIEGTKVYAKFDYYEDSSMQYGAESGLDCYRVLTIMLAEEY